jgi:predicted nucleic acid-binding protein
VAKYTLDTNVLIDALNQPAHLEVLSDFLQWALPSTFLSAVVLFELEAGTQTPRQRTLLEQLVGPFERRGRLFAPSAVAWRQAGQFVAQGVRAETSGGQNDLLLALSCREAGLTLITRDRDFKRLARQVRGLAVVEPFPKRSAREGT